MQQNDPPTAAQFAQVIERLSNLAEDVREVRSFHVQLTQILVDLTGVKRDIANTIGQVQQLYSNANTSASTTHKLDLRLTGLERWQKFVVAMASVSIAVAGWMFTLISDTAKETTAVRKTTHDRLSTMEFIINSRNFENAMKPPPAREGK